MNQVWLMLQIMLMDEVPPLGSIICMGISCGTTGTTIGTHRIHSLFSLFYILFFCTLRYMGDWRTSSTTTLNVTPSSTRFAIATRSLPSPTCWHSAWSSRAENGRWICCLSKRLNGLNSIKKYLCNYFYFGHFVR